MRRGRTAEIVRRGVLAVDREIVRLLGERRARFSGGKHGRAMRCPVFRRRLVIDAAGQPLGVGDAEIGDQSG